jgi:hypothetical protein
LKITLLKFGTPQAAPLLHQWRPAAAGHLSVGRSNISGVSTCFGTIYSHIDICAL